MSGIHREMPLMLAALGLAACASSPPADQGNDIAAVSVPSAVPRSAGPAKRASAELVQLDVDSALSVLRQNAADRDAWLASNLSVGLDDQLLRYQASYSIDRGDLLAGDPEASRTKLGGQRLGQNLSLDLAEFAGTPLSLGFSTESSNSWLVSGFAASQRQQANLEWSPGFAIVDVQWAGAAETMDPSVALNCNVESTIRLPVSSNGDRSQGLRLSGRDCTVAADGTPYAGTAAQAWGMGYVWTRPERQSEAVLSVIDPVWGQGLADEALDPSYQLALSQSRDFGAVSAKALVSLRQATILGTGDLLEPQGTFSSFTDRYWAANAALTWNLAAASVSANWAKGVDRLWFTPEIGERSDRFGLALDLSRWVESLMPAVSPELAMNWNWSEDYLFGERITGNNSLQLNMGWMF